MVVNRRTFMVNKPYFDEAIGLLGEYRRLVHEVHPESVMRIYAIAYGTFDTVAAEWESESVTTLEQQLDAVLNNPQIAERFATGFKRWQEITVPGGTNEVWRLVS